MPAVVALGDRLATPWASRRWLAGRPDLAMSRRQSEVPRSSYRRAGGSVESSQTRYGSGAQVAQCVVRVSDDSPPLAATGVPTGDGALGHEMSAPRGDINRPGAPPQTGFLVAAGTVLRTRISWILWGLDLWIVNGQLVVAAGGHLEVPESVFVGSSGGCDGSSSVRLDAQGVRWTPSSRHSPRPHAPR